MNENCNGILRRFIPKGTDLTKVTSEKLEKILNKINGKPRKILGFISAEKRFNEEIEKIEEHYGISLRNSDNNSLEIEYINIHPSCGHGTIVIDDAEAIPVRIGKELIQDVWKANPHDLKLFKASGDSMQPLIEDDDILLVNTANKDFNNGGIFLLTINNDWFIKRLRLRVTGELDIISENQKYPIETLLPDTFCEIKIFGRVIKNLSRGL